jgi:hypothetical protein
MLAAGSERRPVNLEVSRGGGRGNPAAGSPPVLSRAGNRWRSTRPILELAAAAAGQQRGRMLRAGSHEVVIWPSGGQWKVSVWWRPGHYEHLGSSGRLLSCCATCKSPVKQSSRRYASGASGCNVSTSEDNMVLLTLFKACSYVKTWQSKDMKQSRNRFVFGEELTIYFWEGALFVHEC